MVGHGDETKLLLVDGDMLVNCSCEYGEVILLVVGEEQEEEDEAVAAEAMDFSYLSVIFSAADISRPEMTREPRLDLSPPPPSPQSSAAGSTRS